MKEIVAVTADSPQPNRLFLLRGKGKGSRVALAVLIAGTRDDRVMWRLEDVLHLCRVGFKIGVKLQGSARSRWQFHTVCQVEERKGFRAVHIEVVHEPAAEKQRVNPLRPFMVVAEKQQRLLPLANPQRQIRARDIPHAAWWSLQRAVPVPILRHIARICAEINRLHEQPVVWRDLLLELRRDAELFEIVVLPLAIF